MPKSERKRGSKWKSNWNIWPNTFLIVIAVRLQIELQPGLILDRLFLRAKGSKWIEISKGWNASSQGQEGIQRLLVRVSLWGHSTNSTQPRGTSEGSLHRGYLSLRSYLSSSRIETYLHPHTKLTSHRSSHINESLKDRLLIGQTEGWPQGTTYLQDRRATMEPKPLELKERERWAEAEKG